MFVYPIYRRKGTHDLVFGRTLVFDNKQLIKKGGALMSLNKSQVVPCLVALALFLLSCGSSHATTWLLGGSGTPPDGANTIWVTFSTNDGNAKNDVVSWVDDGFSPAGSVTGSGNSNTATLDFSLAINPMSPTGAAFTTQTWNVYVNNYVQNSATWGWDYPPPNNEMTYQGTPSAAPTPEPGTMALLGLGMAALAVYGKRRANNAY
jgi:hypothetical protein